MSAWRDAFDVVVVDDDLDLHLRHEVDRVLGAAVHLGVPALASESLHLGHGEALDARARVNGVLHVVDLERLDDCNDQLHWSTPLQTRSRA